MQVDRGALREGRLVRWNQQKGFGFIRPSDGGKDVFVHITSLAGQNTPQIGSVWVFSAANDPNGRGLRVVKAVPATDQAGGHRDEPAAVSSPRVDQRRTGPAARQSSGHRARQREPDRTERRSKRSAARKDQTLVPLTLGWRTWMVASAALFCLIGAATTFGSTGWMLAVYPLMSLVAYFMYAQDKLIAIRGGWRIPESSLHMVELLGGWPGAYMAQQTMRHKTVKQPYQAIYWIIVASHVAFWGVWMVNPEILLDLIPS